MTDMPPSAPLDAAAVAGGAAAAISHIVAELVENALQFSPPDEDVEVKGRRSHDIIRQALRESASLQDTFEDVYAVALKKYATLKGKKNPLAKLAYFLQGRGFDGEVITGVIEKIRSGEREEEE